MSDMETALMGNDQMGKRLVKHSPWLDYRDVMQDARIKVAKQWGEFCHLASVNYMRSAVWSAYVDQVRGYERRRVKEMSIGELYERKEPVHTPMEEVEASAWVEYALGHLNEQHQEALRMFLAGLTAKEAAHKLNITVPAYKSRLNRAVSLLRTMLKNPYEEVA